MNKNNEWGNNQNYKIHFNPDSDTNPLCRLSRQFNKPANKQNLECEDSPLIRLSRQLNPEPADSQSAIAADAENSSDKIEAELESAN